MTSAGPGGTTIRLRKVRESDAPDLARAWIDHARAYSQLAPAVFGVPDAEGLGDWLVEGLAAEADPARRLVLIADVDGRAVGFMVAAVVAPHSAPQHQMQRDLAAVRVQIEALVVDRQWQRRGVGTRLMTAAEDWARNRGAVVITAQAYVDGPAPAFLAAVGYAPRAVIHGKVL